MFVNIVDSLSFQKTKGGYCYWTILANELVQAMYQAMFVPN